MIISNRILAARKKPITVVSVTTAIVNHKNVETESAPFTVLGNSRPVNDADTKFLPEGQRADFYRVFNTSTKLRTTDDKASVKGDIIKNHLGFNWRVVRQKTWGRGDRHNAYVIIKTGAAAS